MQSFLSVGAFVVSIVAIWISVLSFRRGAREEKHRARCEAEDLAFSAEMTLKLLLISVLTLDTRMYREEVIDIIEAFRSELPVKIASIESAHTEIVSTESVARLNQISVDMRAYAERAKVLTNMLQVGIDRGQTT